MTVNEKKPSKTGYGQIGKALGLGPSNWEFKSLYSDHRQGKVIKTKKLNNGNWLVVVGLPSSIQSQSIRSILLCMDIFINSH